MIDSQSEHVKHVAQSVEQCIRNRPDQGVLDAQTVFALDIVAHALSFAKLQDGLVLWREVLWQREVSERTRAAVIEMLDFVVSATARGEISAVSQICNCLEAVAEPNILRGSGELRLPAAHSG